MAQMTFAYKVRDTEGKLLEGTLDGDNQGLVANRLRQMGYTPIKVEAKNARTMKKEIRIPGFSGRVPLKDIAIFSRQFATLISAGLTLLRSLTILTTQTENPELAKVVTDVRGQVERGVSLSQAMASHPKVFDRLFVSMVKAGEASGGLDQSLIQLANMLETQAALRGKIKSAMAYPAAVLSLVVLIASAIILFVVPVFKGIYAELHGTLPLPTEILIQISNIAVKALHPYPDPGCHRGVPLPSLDKDRPGQGTLAHNVAQSADLREPDTQDGNFPFLLDVFVAAEGRRAGSRGVGHHEDRPSTT